MKGGEPLGREHEDGNHHAAERCRQPEILDAEIDDDGEELGEQHDGKKGEHEHQHVVGKRPVWRPVVKPLVPGMAPVAFGLGEEGPVSHRLNDDEHEVEQDGDGGEQDRLERGLARVRLGLGSG